MTEEQSENARGMNLRRVERKSLVRYFRIFDGMSNRVLGHIVNISTQGVMLISDIPISINEHHQLRLRLPSKIGNTEELVFSAMSKWSKQDANPNLYITGFEIQDTDEVTSRCILSLIADFGFPLSA